MSKTLRLRLVFTLQPVFFAALGLVPKIQAREKRRAQETGFPLGRLWLLRTNVERLKTPKGGGGGGEFPLWAVLGAL